MKGRVFEPRHEAQSKRAFSPWGKAGSGIRFARLVEGTKLLPSIADTDGMDGRYIEPRKVMWAVAEITWEDDGGTSFRVPAILEDTSRSGACIRVKRPVTIGSRLTIKWHREQFSGIARNCRRDGGDFLLGVRREVDIVSAARSAGHRAAPDAKAGIPAENSAKAKPANSAPPQTGFLAPVCLPEPAHTAPRTVQLAQSHPLSRPVLAGVVETHPPRRQREIHD